MRFLVELEVEIEDCDSNEEAWEIALKVFDDKNKIGMEYMGEGLWIVGVFEVK
jgi:hypothetical protein